MATLGVFAGMLAGALALAQPRFAHQDLVQVDEGTRRIDYRIHWQGSGGTSHDVAFSLATEAVSADLAAPTFLSRLALRRSALAAVRSYVRATPGANVTVTLDRGEMTLHSWGPYAQRDLAGALEVHDREVTRWLAAHHFTRLPSGTITFDHAALVATYAPALAPLGDALWVDGDTDREFVERALSFVQAIPYEARLGPGADGGYRRPLAVLSRNAGDCDSKAVLFLAIVRSQLPDLPAAVVYLPEHAVVGVGADVRTPGDHTFVADRDWFVYAEPVGPTLLPLGALAAGSRHALARAEVRLVATAE